MRITKRDKNVLKALNKLRVLNIEIITSLCEFTHYKRCAERMAILYQNGYVNYYQLDVVSKRYYFITQKGMNVIFPGEERISKKGRKYIQYQKPPRFRLTTLNHEILTAKVLSYLLEWNPELALDDFKTDRDMQEFDPQKRIYNKHLSDLQCEEYHIKIEVELSIKDKKRLRNNIFLNTKNYVQVWITGTNRIYNRLINEQKRYPEFFIRVIKLEELTKEPIILAALYDEFLRKKSELAEKPQ